MSKSYAKLLLDCGGKAKDETQLKSRSMHGVTEKWPQSFSSPKACIQFGKRFLAEHEKKSEKWDARSGQKFAAPNLLAAPFSCRHLSGQRFSAFTVGRSSPTGTAFPASPSLVPLVGAKVTTRCHGSVSAMTASAVSQFALRVGLGDLCTVFLSFPTLFSA